MLVSSPPGELSPTTLQMSPQQMIVKAFLDVFSETCLPQSCASSQLGLVSNVFSMGAGVSEALSVFVEEQTWVSM